MAYIEQPEDEEEGQGQQAQQPLQVGAAAPPSPGQTSATPAAPTGSAAPPAPSQSAGQAPGRYVNFQRYFNANKGAAQASADKLAGGLESQGAAAQNALAQRQSAFGQQSKAGVGVALPTLTQRPASTAPPRATAGAAAEQPAMDRPSVQPAVGNPLLGPQRSVFDMGAAEVQQANAPRAEYTGPNSLAEAPGWDELVANAGKAQQQANLASTPGGLQALLQEQQKGTGYGEGASRFDAGLTGTAGGDRFAALKERFGGLSKSLTDAQGASQQQADYGRGQVAAYNARRDADAVQRAGYQASRDEQLNAMLAKNKAEQDAKTWEAHQKKEDFGKYTKGNAESVVKQVGSWLSPLDMILRGTGNRTVVQGLTPKVEEWSNKNLGTHMDSHRVNFGDVAPDIPSEVIQQVYDSMTEDELAALEGMSEHDQSDWLHQRAEYLRGKTKR